MAPLLPAESLPGIDQCAGLRRLGGRRAVYASLLGRFASDNADVITRLRTLVATAAPREAQQVCHALRGVAGNLGADEICRAATELERSLKSPEERSSVSERLETLEQSVARVLKGLSEHRALLEAVESEPAGPLPAKNLSKNSGRNEAERRAASQGRRPEAPGGVAVVRYIEDDSGRERRMAALQPAAVGRGSWIGSKAQLDGPTITRLASELAADLRNGALETSQRFQVLRDGLQGLGDDEQLARLGRLVNAYDFEEALGVLSSICDALGYPLDPRRPEA